MKYFTSLRGTEVRPGLDAESHTRRIQRERAKPIVWNHLHQTRHMRNPTPKPGLINYTN
jgi:hypothetical protein